MYNNKFNKMINTIKKFEQQTETNYFVLMSLISISSQQ